jgi:tetratricopeptide (TPR) repeat protein
MQELAKICYVCSRVADYGPFGGILVCEGCTRRIANIARGGDGDIWTGGEGRGPDSSSPVDFDENLARFKMGVAGLIPDQDGDSHANLAEAYRQMGLHGEAIREAAMALSAARRTPLVLSALEMLLSPPLLKAEGMLRLRQRLLNSTDTM